MIKQFDILVSRAHDFVLIKDNCHPDFPSVTNDAEKIVKGLFDSAYIRNGENLYYIDSTGRMDELVHDGGYFKDFRSISDERYEHILNNWPGSRERNDVRRFLYMTTRKYNDITKYLKTLSKPVLTKLIKDMKNVVPRPERNWDKLDEIAKDLNLPEYIDAFDLWTYIKNIK